MASEIDPSLRGSVDYDFFEASSPPIAPLKELREVETVEHKVEDSPTKIISVDITTTRPTKIMEKSDEIPIECDYVSDDELSKDESSHSDMTRSRSRSHSSQSSRSSRTSSYSSSESSRSRSSSRSQQSQSSSYTTKSPSSVQSQSHSISPQLSSSKSEVVSSEKLSTAQSVINTDEDLLQPPGKAVRRNTYDVVEVKVPLVKEEEPEQDIKNVVETKVCDDSGSDQSDSDSSGTESDSTDSDMTDVSPLASPDVSPTQSPRHSTKKKDKKARSHKKSMDSSKNGEKPIEIENESEVTENVLQTEQTELKLLMEAVLELDGEKISPNRRVVFEPQNVQRSQQSNYSFSSDRRREIDQENERLLRNIATPKKSTKTGTKIYPDPPFKRLSHSAVNRQREQRKIEDENYKILKRLQKIKPTKEISRDQTLSEYQNRMCGLPFPISQSTFTDEQPKNTLNIPLSQSHRTRSLYSIRSIGSANSTRSNTRNAISARKRGDHKPQWNDRW